MQSDSSWRLWRPDVASSFTDWLFMGVLFHGKYLDTPEIWRIKPGQSETRRIVASSVLGVLSCAAFILLCRWTDALTLRSEMHMAELVWVAGPCRSFSATSCGSRCIRFSACRIRWGGWRDLWSAD